MRATIAAALALLASTGAGDAVAQTVPGDCGGIVSVHARAGIPRGVYGRYDARSIARQAAVAAWTAKVRAECPRSTPSWAAARRRNVSCSYFSGGAGCEASAQPHRPVLR